MTGGFKIVIRRRFAPLIVAVLALGAMAAPHSVEAVDPIEVAWTAPQLVATTRAVPQFVDAIDGAVFVAGSLDGTLDGQTSLGNLDGFVARYDPDGNLIWARHVGTSGTDYLTALVVTPAGIFVGGRTHGPANGTISGRDGFVALLTLSGERVWHFAQFDSHDIPVRLAAMPDGGVMAGMTGYINLPAPDNRRPLFYRHFRPNGTIAWEDESLGWWTDDVDVDSTGFTVAGVAPDGNVGEAFVRRYTHAGELVWSKVVESPVNRDIRVWELASAQRSIWAAGIGLVAIDGSPDEWPDDHRFIRHLTHDGPTVWTRAMNAHRIVSDCGTFLGIGEIIPDGARVPRDAYLARFDVGGVEAWRWTQEGTDGTRVNFNDIAAQGDRAYLIKEEITGGDPAVVRLVALDNVPTPSGCEDGDTAPPSITAPTHRLLNGSAISGGRTPVRVAWTGSDAGTGIARYELAQSTDGGAWSTVSTTLTSANLDRLLAPNHTYRFRLIGVDGAGNASSPVYGPTFRLTHYGETNSRVRYKGTWSLATGAAYWGAKAMASSRAGATASLTFTGRSVEWVARTGPTRGKAQVFINGVLKATVDLYAPTYQNQRVAWTGSWSSSASRTITIKVLGTSGRPRVDLDAFVVGS
jgi:hypothetical protein